MPKDLPSIDDFIDEKNDLSSIDDYITEEPDESLPSVEDFVEQEEEDIEIEEDIIVDEKTDLTEIIRLINDVRRDIPDIPEIKYYDDQLEKLTEQILSFPKVKYYDQEVEAICEQIDLIKEEIKDLPEVKYYDDQVNQIENRIDALQTEIVNLPEVKYYDSEIEAICEAIDKVRSEIPIFPKWVNEINEVPDFSWIGKTFSVIDDDFIKVNDTIDCLREKVNFNIDELSEDIDKKYFENSVKIDSEIINLNEKIDRQINEEKEKIWKEIKASSLKLWEYHREFKDDDRKLKKQILGEYNKLKENINKELKKVNEESVKTDELLLNYFNELKEEISNLPEVKYYDKDIDYIKSDVKSLYKLVEDIKKFQKELQEQQKTLSEEIQEQGTLLADPPDVDNEDPLTPIDQNFVTLDQLQKHYKLFVERVQYQLSSIGGGGAGFIKDLDDVEFDQTTGNNKLLIFDQTRSKWVGIASTSLSGSTALVDLTDVDTSNLGDGRFLRYNASSSEFTFAPVSASNLELIAGDIQSGILTTNSTSIATVISVSASTYRSVNYQVQVSDGTNFNMTTINVIHDGSTTYMSEYGTINQPVGIATFSTDINSGSLRLLGYPSAATTTTFKVIFTAIEA